jgi:hypothetical protein
MAWAMRHGLMDQSTQEITLLETKKVQVLLKPVMGPYIKGSG